MRVLVQWTQSTPRDWVHTNAADWAGLPSKPEPAGGETIDDEPGWPFAVCVQGVTFFADHYAVWEDRGVWVAAWNDDPPETPAGERHGWVWRFRDPAPDPRFGGRVNTRQALTVYAESGAVGKWVPERARTSEGPAALRPWQAFPRISPDLVRHGIWTSDELAGAHNEVRRCPRWEEWV